jgi:hypothetical protein
MLTIGMIRSPTNRIDDLAECPADNDTDRQIHWFALDGKFAKFLHESTHVFLRLVVAKNLTR